ncbi:MAG: CehA/McbA family metallohydrolase [Prosthecobacter sp.]|nr:CehA/McbA family metallohydrolase [Prosthecobacter sp.]
MLASPSHFSRAAWLATCLFSLTAIAQEPFLRALDAKRHFLGALAPREWEDFDGRRPEGRGLEVKFQAQANSEAATLFIREDDVKLDWPVQLNGKKLGKLGLGETKMISTFTVPPGTLKDGENVLSLLAPIVPDDIMVGEIALDTRPPERAVAEAVISVTVTDAESGKPLPCRLTIVDEEDCWVPVLSLKPERTATRAGVVYTADGEAALGLRAGTYTLYANRGFEYSLASQKLTVKAGVNETIKMQIKREVPTPGLVACDTHVHSLAFSGHGDATAEERAITLAGEGVELPIATDHNVYADYAPAAQKAGTQAFFTNVIGNEVTTPTGHFNAFPVAATNAALPNHKLADWPELMTSIRSVPGMQVVILNHPRDTHNKFIPFAPENFNPVTGENLRGAPFTFDGMEIVNSGALQSDLMQNFRDWFALLNHGYRIAAVASSDCHDVARFIVGQGRTYVKVKDDTPNQIDVAAACRSFKEGRVYPSLGLLTRMTVEGRYEAGDLTPVTGHEVRVRINVFGPSWINADTVALYQNGVRVREQAIPAEPLRVEKTAVEWTLPRPAHDVHLVAIASGPGVSGNFWKLAASYQPSSRKRTPRVIGATNPVWVDADGDGKFSAPRSQAEALLKSLSSDADPAVVVAALKSCDEAVAAQAAGLLHKKGVDLRGAAFVAALAKAEASVRTGFEAFLATQK